VRDGTGYLQAVIVKSEVDPAVWDTAEQATQECSLSVTGTIREEKRAPGGYEMTATQVAILGASENYPITPKEHGVDFLMGQRHLWMRSAQQHAVLRVRSEIEQAIRDFFYHREFTLIDSPILTGSSVEGTSTLFETDYFGDKAYLSQSGQLYLEPAAAAFGKVYCFGPTFRAEKSKTRRHLTEFWMIEPEVAFLEFEGLCELAEDFVGALLDRALERCKEDLKRLERGHVEALRRNEALSPDHLPARDRQAPQEGVRGQVRRRPGRGRGDGARLRYGAAPDRDAVPGRHQIVLHAAGPGRPGGRPRPRHARPRRLRRDHRRLAAHSRPEAPRAAPEGAQAPEGVYEWYLDVRRYGTFPHSGFGMGLERFVAWVCGIHHLREAIPYPRTMKRIYP
jgi:asparaginyl-tRNA synthetase